MRIFIFSELAKDIAHVILYMRPENSVVSKLELMVCCFVLLYYARKEMIFILGVRSGKRALPYLKKPLRLRSVRVRMERIVGVFSTW